MSKLIGLILVMNLFGFSSAYATERMSKDQAKSSAIDVCQEVTLNRYGNNSSKQVAKRAKWFSGMRGAAVLVKVKPESKRPRKYYCVVKTDHTVDFYRA